MKFIKAIAFAFCWAGVLCRPGKEEEYDEDDTSPTSTSAAAFSPKFGSARASSISRSGDVVDPVAASSTPTVVSSPAGIGGRGVAAADSAGEIPSAASDFGATLLPLPSSDPEGYLPSDPSSSSASQTQSEVASSAVIDVGESKSVKRESPLDNTIQVDVEYKTESKRSAAAAAALPPSETEGKRGARGTIDVSNAKNKRIIFGTAMTANRMRRKFPVVFCEVERDNGIACPSIKRGNYMDQFYYDPETNRCQHFVYSGCGGNANRFSSLWECNMACAKKSVAVAKLI